MTFDLSTIKRGAVELPPRIVLLGIEKIGKSTFASQFPNAVFLPIKGEEGIDALDVARFPTVTTYSECLEAIGTLYNEEHEFQTVVIDSVSTLEPLIWQKVCEDDGGAPSIVKACKGYGNGFTEALKHWRTITEGLDALRTKGIGSILIGHVKVKQFNDPTAEPYDQYQFDIHDKASNLLYRWADSILFATRKITSRGVEKNDKATRGVAIGDNPILYTRKQPAHPGGGRGSYGRLPYELPLNYDAFVEAIVAAKT